MKTTRYRAWRFRYSNFTDLGAIDGLQLAPEGEVEMVEGPAAIQQAIFLLLSTTPGERVMRPSYGCDIHQLVFAPGDDTTAGLAVHYVRRAIERWEPRVEIRELDAEIDPYTPGKLNIALKYRIRATLHVDTVSLAFSLTGEDA